MSAVVARAEDAFAAGNRHVAVGMQGVVLRVNRNRPTGNHHRFACFQSLAARAVIVTGGIVEVPPVAHVFGFLLRVCASTAADDGNHAARHCQRRFRRHAVAHAGDDDFAVLNGHEALFLVLRLVAGDAVLAGCDRHRAAGDGHAILALDAVPQCSHADIAVLDFQVFRAVDTVVKVAQHGQTALALDFQVNLALQRAAGCFFALRGSGNVHFFAGLQDVRRAFRQLNGHVVGGGNLNRRAGAVLDAHAAQHKGNFRVLGAFDNERAVVERPGDLVCARLDDGDGLTVDADRCVGGCAAVRGEGDAAIGEGCTCQQGNGCCNGRNKPLFHDAEPPCCVVVLSNILVFRIVPEGNGNGRSPRSPSGLLRRRPTSNNS